MKRIKKKGFYIFLESIFPMDKKYNSSLSHFADDFIFISNSNNNLKYITRQQSKKRQD